MIPVFTQLRHCRSTGMIKLTTVGSFLVVKYQSSHKHVERFRLCCLTRTG